MKDEALSIVRGVEDPARKLNLLREYVQVLALRSLHESEAFAGISFQGGTALRFAFGLPRFSEDLDFSVEDQRHYAPEAWMKKVKGDLALAGFHPSVNWNPRAAVHKAWVRLAGVLHEAGLVAMREQKLSIKIELDTRPPAGAVEEREVITRHRMFVVRRYDMASLMAGKIHALITRPYAKGRDWYDLMWYLGHRPPQEPNLVLLQNALDQTQGKDAFRAEEWKQTAAGKLEDVRTEQLADDVRPFLEHPEDERLLTVENIRSALRAGPG
jgi:predicted nucleotidyltransferase component of viral defense system